MPNRIFERNSARNNFIRKWYETERGPRSQLPDRTRSDVGIGDNAVETRYGLIIHSREATEMSFPPGSISLRWPLHDSSNRYRCPLSAPPSSVALRRRFRSMELDVMQCPIRLSTERRLSIAPWVTESLSTVREASHFTRRRRSQWSRLPDCTSLDSNSSTISWFALLLANMKPRWPQYFLLNKSLWRTRVFVETNTRFCRQTFFELLTNL